MDAYLKIAADTLQTLVSYINSGLNKMPLEILYFGLVAGFFCSLPESNKSSSYGRQNETRLLVDIKRASSILSLLAVLGSIAYVYYFIGERSALYLISFILAGLLLHALFFKAFSRLDPLGACFRSLTIILSGPAIIFTFWFFHVGELSRIINHLVEKLPF